MKKQRPDQKNPKKDTRMKSRNSVDPEHLLETLGIGSAIGSSIGILFLMIILVLAPIPSPAYFFVIPGVIAGVIGALIGDWYGSTRKLQQKSLRICALLGAVILSSLAVVAIFLYYLQMVLPAYANHVVHNL